MVRKFRVGIAGEFLDAQGQVRFGDVGLGLLDTEPLVEYEFFGSRQAEVLPSELREYDAVVALGGRYTRRSLEGGPRLALIARFGVGYDNVDVEACTEAGVMLTITPDGVRRPVATCIIALILALSLGLVERDRYARAGRSAAIAGRLGTGLTGRVLGSVGIGNIGREMFRLAAPFGMVHLAHDPFVRPAEAASLGIRLVELETLLREADFLSINCPLTASTRRLIGARELSLMKPSAFLINTARGGIVDTAALTRALREGQIAGAGLDVTDPEPLPEDHPLLGLDNVITTSHQLCWTDECVLGNGRSAIEAVLAVARGEIPRHVVNSAVLTAPALLGKLAQYRSPEQSEP